MAHISSRMALMIVSLKALATSPNPRTINSRDVALDSKMSLIHDYAGQIEGGPVCSAALRDEVSRCWETVSRDRSVPTHDQQRFEVVREMGNATVGSW
jgi:hypothetical protein